MEESLKLIGFALLWIVIGIFLSCFITKCGGSNNEVLLSQQMEETRRDTILLVDTIVKLNPAPAHITATEKTTRRLPIYKTDTVYDSIKELWFEDSISVEIERTQVEYRDSMYAAWVSGFEPRLDSIKFFRESTIVEVESIIKQKHKRWHIGPTIGYGYTPQGFQPYIGVSLTYSLFEF